MTTVSNPLEERALQVSVYASGKKLDIPHRCYVDSVELSTGKEPNRATVTIYNLGKSNRGILSSEHQAIEIVAGYKNPGKIFSGQTVQVLHRPPGQGSPEWETTIIAGDGVKEYRESWISSSWSAGTSFNAVISEIGTRNMGLPVLSEIVGKLPSSWAFNGKAVDALTELCEGIGARWFIYQGVLEVRPAGNSTEKTEASAVLLSSGSGMIGIPELVERKPKGGKKRFGISARSLMNPALRPSGLVKIETTAPTAGLVRTKKSSYTTPGVGGVYRIERVTHYGGLHTVEFYSEIETEAFYG